jgi:hypothetical protein
LLKQRHSKRTKKAVIEAGSSIFLVYRKLQQGGVEQLASLFQGDNAQNASNPVVQKLTEQLTGSLGEKFGINADAASGVAGSLIQNLGFL